MAFLAASTARFSPVAEPVPIRAIPMPAMTVFTSAKSRLMSPGTMIKSEMPCTAWRKNVVGNPERIEQAGTAIERGQQAFVGNRDDGVHTLLEIRQSALGLSQTLLAFESERLRHNGNGQCAQFGGETRDDWRGARSGAAAETGRHEDHVGAFQRLNDLLRVLQRGLPADLGICAGSKTLGQLVANLKLHGRLRLFQRLYVGIRDKEFHSLEARCRSCG